MLTYDLLQRLENRDALRSDDSELRSTLAQFGYLDLQAIRNDSEESHDDD